VGFENYIACLGDQWLYIKLHPFYCLTFGFIFHPFYCLIHSLNFVKNWQPTSTKQHGVGTSAQRNIKDKVANQSTEKGENKFQSCQPIVQKEQPEICCDAILSNTEAQNDKLQCTDGTKSPVPVSSSVCDPMHIDRMTSRTEDSNTSAHVEINYHQAPENPRSDQCKNKSSPLLTFHRRVKKRTSSAEPTEENCSPDNKQCSTLTCNPPKSSQDTMLLLKHTNVESSDIEPKVLFPVILSCISMMM
jgi:hypothetical protein